MKHIKPLLAACLLTAGAAQAQFYGRVGAGYALPNAGQNITGDGVPYNGTYTNGTQDNYSYKSASFSAGTQVSLGLGYTFGRHVGAELDVNTGISPKTYTYMDRNANVTYGGSPSPILSDIRVTHRALAPVVAIPALVLHSGGNVWDLYTRLGVALPIKARIEQVFAFTNQPGTGAVSTRKQYWEMTHYFSVGFSGAVGVQYKLNKHMNLWGEVGMQSMSLYVKEANLTKYVYNGQSIPLSQLTGGTKTTQYNKSGMADSTGAQQPTYAQPFSNVSFNVGVSYRL